MTSPAGSPLKPAKLWYWLGGLLIAAGLIGGALLAVNAMTTMSDTVENFGRIRIPGGENCRLVFSQPGTYTVYYEHHSTLPTRGADCKETGAQETLISPKIPPLGLEVSLLGPSGQEISSSPAPAKDPSMSLEGRVGIALREVTITEAGDYRLRVDGMAATTEPFVLSVGRGRLLGYFGYMVGGMAVGALGLLLGLATILVTASKRRKRRSLRLAQNAVAGATITYPPRPDSQTVSASITPVGPPPLPWSEHAEQPNPPVPLPPPTPWDPPKA